ncbi:MAG TPA: hypothetical protein VFW19_09865 [Allosphingosinicella sp.]|nr:hypothetical protein [Allosphingosinicella sp.]
MARAQGDSANAHRCDQSAPAKKKRSMLGGMLGGLASRAADRAGVPSSVGGVSVPTSSLLSDAITALLDCREQQQAAAATNEAMRGGVGTTSTWKSDSRPDVSGSSTVNSQDKLADGTQCLTVTDVVIVNGEETTAPKRMCRAPGASGYTRV